MQKTMRTENKILLFSCLVSLIFVLLAVFTQKNVLVLLPLGIVVVSVIIINPRFIPLVFVVSFFIGHPVKEIGIISIDWADVTFFILIMSIISTVLVPGMRLKLEFNQTTKKLFIIFLLFSAICLISILVNLQLKNNKDIATSIWYFLNLLQLGFIIVLFSQQEMLKFKELIISIILVLSVFEQFLALFQYFQSGATSIDDMRSVLGTFVQHHAMLGNMMIISLSLFLYRFLNVSSKKWKILYSVGILLSLNTIIISGSRSGMIGIACAFLILLTLRFRINKKYLIYVGIFLFIAFLIVRFTPLNSIILDTIKNKNTGTVDLSSYGRLLIWKGAILQFVNESIIQKICGVGLGNYYTIKYPFVLFGNVKSASGAHNNFLHVLLETGIIGFIIFITYFITIISELTKRIKKDNLAFSFLFATLALLFSGFTQETFWFQPAFGPLWMYYTFILVMIFGNKPQVNESVIGPVKDL